MPNMVLKPTTQPLRGFASTKLGRYGKGIQ